MTGKTSVSQQAEFVYGSFFEIGVFVVVMGLDFLTFGRAAKVSRSSSSSKSKAIA